MDTSLHSLSSSSEPLCPIWIRYQFRNAKLPGMTYVAEVSDSVFQVAGWITNSKGRGFKYSFLRRSPVFMVYERLPAVAQDNNLLFFVSWTSVLPGAPRHIQLQLSEMENRLGTRRGFFGFLLNCLDPTVLLLCCAVPVQQLTWL